MIKLATAIKRDNLSRFRSVRQHEYGVINTMRYCVDNHRDARKAILYSGTQQYRNYQFDPLRHLIYLPTIWNVTMEKNK